MKYILLTGGAGYIGSHTAVELIAAGYTILIMDNFSNSSPLVIERLKTITQKEVVYVKGDIRSEDDLESLFSTYKIEAVIHFAGLKAVGESVEKPHLYYENNVVGSLNLFKVMAQYNCRRLVFSSSATVYGIPSSVPITEDFPLHTTNPYGRTKLMIEEILRDLYQADNRWQIALLRYFNPIGAHSSGLIGEDPNDIPNNLMPYITQVAVGKLPHLNIFGDDYHTSDGTGVRDYIHVVDLAQGHVKALAALEEVANEALVDKVLADQGLGDKKQPLPSGLEQPLTVNLGTGKGYSVLEMVNTFEEVTGQPIPYKITQRRAGDAPECYADPSRAKRVLGWQAQYDLAKMCRDSWRWQAQNPDGYQ